MSTAESSALIDHGPGCARPAPSLRRSWSGAPEVACNACGRYAPAPDTRQSPTAESENR